MRKKRPRRRDRPVADRARQVRDELGGDGPRVQRLSKEEDVEACFAAGVRAAGDSNRPAGSHAAPEYPVDDPPSEISTDQVIDVEPEDPDAPEPTARPRGE